MQFIYLKIFIQLRNILSYFSWNKNKNFWKFLRQDNCSFCIDRQIYYKKNYLNYMQFSACGINLVMCVKFKLNNYFSLCYIKSETTEYFPELNTSLLIFIVKIKWIFILHQICLNFLLRVGYKYVSVDFFYYISTIFWTLMSAIHL